MKDAMLTEESTTNKNMARPRLVVELNDPEFNYLLKGAALSRRMSVREAVLLGLGLQFPDELGEAVQKELSNSPTLRDSLAKAMSYEVKPPEQP